MYDAHSGEGDANVAPAAMKVEATCNRSANALEVAIKRLTSARQRLFPEERLPLDKDGVAKAVDAVCDEAEGYMGVGTTTCETVRMKQTLQDQGNCLSATPPEPECREALEQHLLSVMGLRTGNHYVETHARVCRGYHKLHTMCAHIQPQTLAHGQGSSDRRPVTTYIGF
jgi:hypothetical protein